MSYKEEIGLVGLIVIAIVCALQEEYYYTGLALVALVAYIGGNHNGELRNTRLAPP